AGDASRALAGLDALARRAAQHAPGTPDADLREQFAAHMDDDLDTPAALALVFKVLHRANQAFDEGDVATGADLAATVAVLCSAVGLELRSESDDVPEDVAALARERDEARASKDWKRADE